MGRTRIALAAAAIAIVMGSCTTVSPTASPAAPSASSTPTPTPRPTILGPEWVQAAAERAEPGGAQWTALEHPDVPYTIGGSANANPNAVTFTPNLARQWWDLWFSSPVDLADVDSGLLPGALVLSAEELRQVSLLTERGNTLPKAPRDYNPLELPVLP